MSLRRLPELARITVQPPGQTLEVGAMVTHRAIETSDLVRSRASLLAEACAQVANIRVRTQATLGGNLIAADYASDPPAALIALDARVRLRSAGSEEELPVRNFITGYYQTTLQPTQLLTEIIVPIPPPHSRGAYLKFKTRSSEDRPCLNVAALVSFEDSGCREVRVVVGAAADRPQVVDEALELARGERLSRELIEEIAQAYGRAIEPIEDLRGSAWYRRQVIPVLVRRALLAVANLSAED
jgi:carbon-monoxide dehydrogenase medium subunit